MKLPHRRHFLHLTARAVALSAATPRSLWRKSIRLRPVRLLARLSARRRDDVVARLIGPVSPFGAARPAICRRE